MAQRERFGPWMKLYADVVERKAHYTDRQFRALIETFVQALRSNPRGSLPPRVALEARLGRDEVAFLFEQGDLIDGEPVTVCRWDVYQAGVLSTPRVQKLRVDNVDGTVDKRSETVSETVPKHFAASSTSTSTESLTKSETNPPSRARGPEPDSDRDALDRYYELTQLRPWGRRAGDWIAELQGAHGIPNVVAALEVEARSSPDQKTLLGRVAARLEAQAHRVDVATKKARGPRPVDPLILQIRDAIAANAPGDLDEPEIDTSPAAIASAKAALAELVRPKPRQNGASVRVGDLLGSGQGGSAAGEQPGTSLTADESSDRESAAARDRKGPTEGSATPSPGAKAQRGSRRSAEPGDAEPDRPAAPTVGA